MTKSHEPCGSRGYCFHACNGSIGGRIGGRIQGNRNIESGHLARARKKAQEMWAGSQENRAQIRAVGRSGIGGRIGGRVGGYIAARKNVASGQVAENGYGIPCVTEDGILVKSMTEAAFYGVALALGGEPRYEPCVINGYTPDFILEKSVLGLPANVPIELKPCKEWRRIRNSRQHIPPNVLVVYANELWGF